jgi:polyisoprenoid-binding protein YceI
VSAVWRRPALVVAVTVLLALVAVGGYGIWYLFLQGPGPAAVSGATLAPIPSPQAGGTPAGGFDGTWSVDTSIGSFSDFSDSFVGYRVQEQLASIGANTAVGRTPNVSGSLTMSGTTVTAATVTADLGSLTSDDDRRDQQLTHQAIETSIFPTATFTLTAPIDLGSAPAAGQVVSVTAQGQLMLHGVTRDVSIELQAQESGSVIEVSGSLEISWADYNISKPTSFSVLSIADTGTMELQLFFTKS